MDDGTRLLPGPCPAGTGFAGDETPGEWGDLLRGDADRGLPGRPGGREAARLCSAAVFGSRFFAEVVIAVDRLSGPGDAGVTVRMVAAGTGLVDSVVRPVMRRLCDGGLVTESARGGRARSPLRYQVRRTPLWAGVLSACAALAGPCAPGGAVRGDRDTEGRCPAGQARR